MVAAASYLITGGLLPAIEQNPVDPEHVQIDDTSANSDKDNLQLVNIGIKAAETPTPEVPVPTDEPTPTTGPGTPTPTPRPSRTPTPTRRPGTPTPTDKLACLNQTVITLMIDLSQSMGNDGKIGALNDALEDFVSVLPPNTYVGGTAFGSEDFNVDNTEGVSHIIGYTRNKALLSERVSNLVEGPAGGTFIRNGFKVALARIRAEKPLHPGYRQIAIFFSDGVPEMYDYRNPTCYDRDGEVCWAREQDPRRTPYGLTSTNYTDELEAEVDKVYSVAVYNSDPNTRGAGLTEDLKTLLKTIASGGSSPYYQAIDLRSGQVKDLKSYFRSIVNDVCS